MTNAEFEQLAEKFYLATGLMAPGKDAAGTPQAELEHFQAWVQNHRKIQRLTDKRSRLELLQEEIQIEDGLSQIAHDLKLYIGD